MILPLFGGMVAFSLGAHARARTRKRLRPNAPQPKRIAKAKMVNRQVQNATINVFESMQANNSNGCGCP